MYKLCALIGLLFIIEACLARPGSAPENRRRGPPARRAPGPPPPPARRAPGPRGAPPPARVQPPPPPSRRRPPPPPPRRVPPPPPPRRVPPPPAYNSYYDYYGTSPSTLFLADDCDCNKGDCSPGTTYQGSCGDDMNYCC
ncbi:uncharacterized protein LOC125663789 [Ostrea edulis]|uniref:uncharacterized protein LOC125663789 n=1 Tax=Ostrea edulis TaxID=37623 RepID=UPI0024AF4647|nr:uncharacterized protein LOC125663789 [Ostrea edulis]